MTFGRSVILGLQLAAIAVTVWGIGKTSTKLIQSETPMFVIASPSNVYRVGDHITINATLSLPDAQGFPTTLQVCTFGLSTIRVKSITRDGVRIQPVEGVSNFMSDPRIMQDSYLQTIASGDTVLVPWTIGIDLTGFAFLKDVRMNGAYCQFLRNQITGETQDLEVPAFETRMFQLDAPGVYKIQLSYQYHSPLRPGVFTDSLDSNELTLQIK